MSSYGVGKVLNKQSDAIEYMYFDGVNEADDYARRASLGDRDHFYVVEVSVNDDEYRATKIFHSGSGGVTF